jgi:uncharacterized YigZ family protein
MTTYTTLSRKGTSLYEEKKSSFEGLACSVRSESEAQAMISEVRRANPRARHVIYAYVLSTGQKGYSDDGEPQGSAGIPVLDLIEKSGITDVCITVVRYFGGVLLGAGPLMRAYLNTAKQALFDGEPKTFENYSVCRMTCSYSTYQRVLPELERLEAIIDGTSFTDEVTLNFALRSELAEMLGARICEMSGARVAFDILGERFDCKR